MKGIVAANSKIMDDYDVICKILPTEVCNYSCSFCYTPGRNSDLSLRHKFYNLRQKYKNTLLNKKNIIDLGVDTIAAGLAHLPKSTLISISGGEPFVFPKFVDLCSLLTQHHDIRIASNLSTRSVYRFADTVDPKKVYLIIAGFHIEQVEQKGDVDDFISKVECLTQKGFAVSVVCVMYPPTFHQFKEYHDLFAQHGIDLLPRVYDGFYHAKKYPEAYTEEERAFIAQYSVSHPKHIDNQNTFLESNVFTGHECFAGKKMLFIYPDGNAYRCSDDKLYLGHIGKGDIHLLSSSKKCRASSCSCPSWGRRLQVESNNKTLTHV